MNDGTNTYLYGVGRIAQVNTGTEYFLGDALGSVRQLTDASGDITLAKQYDPYGSVAQSVGSGESIYAYTGEQTDVSGLVYLRTRYYSSGTGRFLTRDSWMGEYNRPLSLNRWMYVEGNPVKYTDPSGLSPYATFTGAFTAMDKVFIEMALERVAQAYLRGYNDFYIPVVIPCAGSDLESIRLVISQLVKPTNLGPLAVFYKIHRGPIQFVKLTDDVGNWAETASRNQINIFDGGLLSNFETYKYLGGTIKYGRDYLKYVNGGAPAVPADFDAQNWTMVYEKYMRFITHEVGHAFDRAVFGNIGKQEARNNVAEWQKQGKLPLPEKPSNLGGFCGTRSDGWQWRLASQYDRSYEIFADMFVGWVYECEFTDPRRADYMNTYMPGWIYDAVQR